MLIAAAAVVATPFLIGAQQHTSNPSAGWPCGARLDPSYFQLAEGSGGHLLLLAPEEIADSATLLSTLGAYPQTILRLAGAMTPGLHEFHVPIDPSVEGVLFSISVQCLQGADVMRPSGQFVGGDDVTDFSNFRAQRVVTVRRPEAGIWTVRVAGSGISAIIVQAQAGIALGQVQFQSSPGTAFTALPSVGVENAVKLRISGEVADLKASFVSGELEPLGSLELAPGETAGSYVSHFTPGTRSFRLLVAGKDPDGFAFQRMQAPLLTAAR
jgi:hypothetical protein